MAAKPRKKAPGTPKAADAESIRVRAYEIYLQRGHHGNPVEDWLRAERELLEQSAH